MTLSPRLPVQILIGLGLTVAGLLAARWIAATTPEPPPAPPRETPSVSVRWRTLAPATLQRQVLVHGNLKPQRAAALALSVGGEVREVWSGWSRGARVEEGQKLLTLDSRSGKAELRRAQARLTGAQVQLAQAEESQRAALILEGLAAQSHELAQEEEQRWETLAQEGQGVPSAHDQARSRTVAMNSAWQQAQLARQSSALGVDAAHAAEAQAAAAVEVASVQLELHTLRAPFTGVVGGDAPAHGAWIAPGQAVVEVLDDSALLMVAHVPEGEAAEVMLGSPVSVSAAVLGSESVSGQVVGRSPRADGGTRSVGVEILLEQGVGGGVVSGFASAILELPALEGALILRRSEMVWDQGTPMALVLEVDEDGTHRAAARKLTLGRSNQGSWEVLEGLAVGDRLIVAPLAALSPGSLVNPDGESPLSESGAKGQ